MGDLVFSAIKYIMVIGIGIVIISETGNWIVGGLFFITGAILMLNNDTIRRKIFSFSREFISKMRKEVKNNG